LYFLFLCSFVRPGGHVGGARRFGGCVAEAAASVSEHSESSAARSAAARAKDARRGQEVSAQVLYLFLICSQDYSVGHFEREYETFPPFCSSLRSPICAPFFLFGPAQFQRDATIGSFLTDSSRQSAALHLLVGANELQLALQEVRFSFFLSLSVSLSLSDCEFFSARGWILISFSVC
jgi:hypothetical protein